LCCDAAEFGPGHSGPKLVAFFRPHAPVFTAMRVSGICRACAARSDIEAAILAAYRRWRPDLRLLDPAHLHETGGRA
jgi:hypothetical protein